MLSAANLRRDIVFFTIARLKRVRMLKALTTSAASSQSTPPPSPLPEASGRGNVRKNKSHIVRVRNDELHKLICELVASDGLTYQAAFEQIINGIFDGQSDDSTEAEADS